MYGGAAGGGKSDSLLMAALQYADVPGYAALILRRTFKDLSQPDAIMDRAHQWLRGTAAHWGDEKKRWTFPSGATLTFGHCEHDIDRYQYQGPAFQFIGFDELTQFSEIVYRYLFSRLRRLAGSHVPIRMRSATNPGGIGHDWVKQRFIVERKPTRRFVPAKLDDNPSLDRTAYIESLRELDPFTLEQLLNGEWFARPPGTKFRREWFTITDDAPVAAHRARYWDLAATEPKAGNDPDWTCGALVAEKDGRYWICDIRRIRTTPRGVEALIRQTAELDGKAVGIVMEQEPGSSGVNTIDHYARTILKGHTFKGNKTTGSKEIRANPVSSAAEAGNIMLLRGQWVTDFLDEATAFPGGSHDDQVDAVSGAIEELTSTPEPVIVSPGSMTKQSTWTSIGRNPYE